MARMTWTLFGLILMAMVGASMRGVAATGEEEKAAASDGVGGAIAGGGKAVGGEGHGARGVETGGAAEIGVVGGDDRGVGRGARLEEGEASGMGDSDDSTFQDLPELSSESRPRRLRQGTIFEMFEVERGFHRQCGGGTSAPVLEEEELGSEDDEDDEDFDMEAEVPGEEEDEEEPTQVRCGEKRRRIYEGVGIAG